MISRVCEKCGSDYPLHLPACPNDPAHSPERSEATLESWAKLHGDARHHILTQVEDLERARPRTIFTPGVTPIPASGKVVGQEELRNGVAAVLDAWFTEGNWTRVFESAFERWLGVRRAAFCNSGSSANLLAMSALVQPDTPEQFRLQPGDEVVTAATGFPTTLNAILHAGLKPVFVNVEVGTYVPTADTILNALRSGPHVRAIFMAHTLGNPLPLDQIMPSLGAALVLEDNCDALGSTLRGNKTGTFGVMATQSFYPAHHITTGEGGMVVTQRPALHKIIESLRDWGRDCWCEPGLENTCGKRFAWEFDGLPAGYDHKYVYSHIGYNLKATDMQAAIGAAQLAQLDRLNAVRRMNFQLLYAGLADLQEEIILPQRTEGADPAWFGFPITLRHGFRRDLISFLDSRKIGTRLLFGGNLLRQPAYRNLEGYRIFDRLSNSDRIAEATFWIGCWPGLTTEMLNYVLESLHDFWKGWPRA